MDMIQFGMKNTLVGFRDKHFNYKGAAKEDDLIVKNVALAIGGYESAFLADLVALYLLEITGKKFIKAKYKGIYRDNGLTVLVGKWNKVRIVRWLEDFQLPPVHHGDMESLQRNKTHLG
eukprot:15148407-Ditylum_brightwellii.AAC.1